MFHNAALKLTGWYLAIIMLVSLVFSVALYHVSAQDLDRNVNRQISYYTGFLSPDDLSNYSLIRQQQLNEDRQHLKTNLLSFNVLVLVFGGLASYGLARRTLEPIEESLEAQKRFAADASHELRTPLTAMQSEIEVALRDPKLTKTEAIAQLTSNLEEVAKLKNLSESLLKLAHANQARSTKAIDLGKATGAAVERLDKMAKSKKIIVESKLKSINVTGDSQNITDLVAVLLDNAVKYSPAGSKVSVGVSRKGKFGCVKISDHGQGIAAKDLPHIFERFYRADTSRTKNKVEGYGLGLALAKKIADVHGGHIEVHSTLGKGSTFSAYFLASS